MRLRLAVLEPPPALAVVRLFADTDLAGDVTDGFAL
jgi:hypothetical protein